MKNSSFFILFISFFISSYTISGQNKGFRFLNKEKQIEDVNFQLINNIIVIPLEINGKILNFILDTGVNKTIVFNSSMVDTIISPLEKKYQLRGLGKGSPVNAIISSNNSLKLKNLEAVNKKIYIILKDDFDLSSKMGMTIHGVIGYDLLSNLILRIDYRSKKIRFYKPSTYNFKKCYKCEVLPLTIFQNKPYIDVHLTIDDNSSNIPVKMLIDSGGSDALWLFEDSKDEIRTPDNYFVDFLGVGLSGTIYGKRSRISSLKLGKFTIHKPTVSFLDTLSTINARKFNERNGSIGTGVLKRFKVWIDYPNKRIMLKKNSSFSDHFNYNMTGIELVYNGKVLVKEESRSFSDGLEKSSEYNRPSHFINTITNYVFKFKPSFKINNVVKGSPADKAGVMKGDILLKINGKPVYNYKLDGIISIFQEKENKTIRLRVLRDNKTLTLEFKLKKIV